MASSSDTALAITAVGQSMVAYQFFLPPLSAARRGEDAAMAADVRLGLVAATTVSLGVALMLANLSGNFIPVYASVLISGVVVVIYEMASRGRKVFE